MSMPSGAWSIATIEVALKVENGIHTPIIVNESYNSHDKEKELYCNVLHLGVSKLLSLRTTVAKSFVVLHACALHFFIP